MTSKTSCDRRQRQSAKEDRLAEGDAGLRFGFQQGWWQRWPVGTICKDSRVLPLRGAREVPQ